MGFRLVTWAVIVSFVVGQAPAAPPAAGPSESVLRPSRLVKLFDFEETDDRGQKLGLGHPLPRNWYAIGRNALNPDPYFQHQPLHQEMVNRSGFPAYCQVRFDRQHVSSGEFSLHLGLNGGSAGAFLEIGALTIVPGSDYLLTANVLTDRLRHSSARVTAYFIDASGHRIDSSRVESEPLRTKGKWTPVWLKLMGDFGHAERIGLELELLQPGPSPDDPLGKLQLVIPDVDGGAWFDDIGVWQLPHVEVATQSRVNVVVGPQQPKLTMNVRDLTHTRMMAVVTVYDHNRVEVARASQPVAAGAPSRWEWSPQLPGFGWYLIDMAVAEQVSKSESAAPIARTIGAVLWLPREPDVAAADAGRFTIVAEGVPDEHLNMLTELIDAASVQSVVISAWAEDTTRQNMDQRQDLVDSVLRNAVSAGKQVAISLHPIPTALAQSEGVDASQPLGVLQGPQKAWLPYLLPVLMRHGQRVRHWQLGTSSQATAFFYDDLAEVYARIEAWFRSRAPQPILLLPWRLDQSRRPLPAPAYLAMDVPTGVVPQYIGEHLSEWRDPPSSYSLYLNEPPADQVGQERRVADLALRMLYGWEAGATGLALSRPWAAAAERRDAILPDPILGVFSNVARRLAGRSVLDHLDLDDGLECMILHGRSGGLLAAWNVSAGPSQARLDMFLGDAPVAIDVWGNRQAIKLVDGKHRLGLTKTPIFIDGINPELAMFRAGFGVTPSFVQSSQTTHEHTISLTNPWPLTISGYLQITGPVGWTIRPVRHYFSLSSGQSFSAPMSMTFPIAEVAGRKRLEARFEFTADQPYSIDLGAPLELGLENVNFDATVTLAPGAKPDTLDAVVVCLITNTADQTQALYAFANLWGRPRQERIIAKLEPGQLIVRRFSFENVGDTIFGHAIRVGVRETKGPAILNMELSMDLDAQ